MSDLDRLLILAYDDNAALQPLLIEAKRRDINILQPLLKRAKEENKQRLNEICYSIIKNHLPHRWEINGVEIDKDVTTKYNTFMFYKNSTRHLSICGIEIDISFSRKDREKLFKTYRVEYASTFIHDLKNIWCIFWENWSRETGKDIKDKIKDIDFLVKDVTKNNKAVTHKTPDAWRAWLHHSHMEIINTKSKGDTKYYDIYLSYPSDTLFSWFKSVIDKTNPKSVMEWLYCINQVPNKISILSNLDTFSHMIPVAEKLKNYTEWAKDNALKSLLGLPLTTFKQYTLGV